MLIRISIQAQCGLSLSWYQLKTVLPFPRVNSGMQAAVKEHTSPKHSHASTSKHSDAKQKTGFTISNSGDDEDGWVSSEAGSGAVTPHDCSDEERSGERSRTPVKEARTTPALEKDEDFQVSTPRAESSMSRVPTARPTAPSEAPPQAPVKYGLVDLSNHHLNKMLTHQPNAMESRSEATSPNHYHYRRENSKRHSMSRPPSVHSIRSETPLRPHPLIRGNSYAQGVALGSTKKPAPLAPLTVTSGSSAAQISSSPPDSSSSPTSIKTIFDPQSPNRRTSFSSTRSVSTMPMTPISPAPHNKQHSDRGRTLSTSSTSFATLTSLAHLPSATSRPSTPQYTSHFPQPNPHVNLDTMHPLLPPPYLGAHLTALATKSPVRASFDRVVQAKQGV